jgi:hypothetical protein
MPKCRSSARDPRQRQFAAAQSVRTFSSPRPGRPEASSEGTGRSGGRLATRSRIAGIGSRNLALLGNLFVDMAWGMCWRAGPHLAPEELATPARLDRRTSRCRTQGAVVALRLQACWRAYRASRRGHAGPKAMPGRISPDGLSTPKLCRLIVGCHPAHASLRASTASVGPFARRALPASSLLQARPSGLFASLRLGSTSLARGFLRG